MVAIHIVFKIMCILPILITCEEQLSLLFLKGKNVFFIRAVDRNIFCCSACPVYNVAFGGNIVLVLLNFKIWMDEFLYCEAKFCASKTRKIFPELCLRPKLHVKDKCFH